MGKQVSILAALAVAACLLVPASAAAWSNGGDNGEGFGTHDWILVEASDLVRENMGEGYAWVDLDEAVPTSDNPDTVWHDYRNHLYYPAAPGHEINGMTGTADAKSAEMYAQVVGLLRKGDRKGASRVFGALSHYYDDIENPYHVGSTEAEKDIHPKYEKQVLTRTDTRPRDPGFVSWDGYDAIPDVASSVRDNAAVAYEDYDILTTAYLVWKSKGKTGMPPTVEGMTGTYLDRASNHLADLMAQAAIDAGKAPAPPGSDTRSADVTAPAAGPSGDGGPTGFLGRLLEWFLEAIGVS